MVLGGALLAAVAIAWLLGAQLFPSRRCAASRRTAGLRRFCHSAAPLHTAARTRSGRLILPLQAATYGLLALFLLFNLRGGRELWLVVLGLVANIVPILANGGRMPISLAAWKAIGGAPEQIQRTGYYANDVLAGPHSHFAWLGDVFALPASVPYSSALSIGDVLITFGLAAFIYRACTLGSGGLPARVLEPIRFPDFRRLILGRTVSRLGDWMTMAAIVTWVFLRTHSTLAVSAFLIFRILGLIAGGIAAAPILDRVPRFRALSTVEALRGVLTLLMLPLAVYGLVGPVIAVVCLSSFLGAATNPSASSLVPELLPANLLHRGNALHGVTRNIVMVAGSALGALSVGTLGIAPSLIIDLGTFTLAAALYVRLGGGMSSTSEEPVEEEVRLSRRDLLRGLARNRVLLGLTASFTLVTAAIGVLNASLPQFLTGQVAEPAAYGYALAAIGLGLTCGEFLTGLIHRESVARRSVGLAFPRVRRCDFPRFTVTGGCDRLPTAFHPGRQRWEHRDRLRHALPATTEAAGAGRHLRAGLRPAELRHDRGLPRRPRSALDRQLGNGAATLGRRLPRRQRNCRRGPRPPRSGGR